MAATTPKRLVDRGCLALIATINKSILPRKRFQPHHVSFHYENIHCRSYVSRSGSGGLFGDTPSSDQQQEEQVLFQRQNGNYGLMRSGIAISCLNTAYWICRTSLPTVNQAMTPGDAFYIDPSIGLGMSALAVAIQGVIMLYPRTILSKMTWKPDTQQLLLYAHRLPFVLPGKKPIRTAVLGTVVLDPTSRNSKLLIGACDGDFHRYKGALPIHEKKANSDSYKWPPLTLQIESPENVPDPELLYNVLINPQKVINKTKRQQQQQQHDYDDDDDDLEYMHMPRRRQHARRKSHMKHKRRTR